MTTYLIDPKAPLLFRDGRPFGAAERAETLPFPLPSTVVGALRGAYGDAQGLDFSRQKDQVMRLQLAGLLPARRHLESGAVQVLFPKPADALYLQRDGLVPQSSGPFSQGDRPKYAVHGAERQPGTAFRLPLPPGEGWGEGETKRSRPFNPLIPTFSLGEKELRGPRFLDREPKTTVVRLAPIPLAPEEGTDLPHGLLPVGIAGPAGKGKPLPGAAFWQAEAMQRWLVGESVAADELGVDALPVETRTHVAMDEQTFSNRAGQLFQTTGLDFGPRRLDGPAAGWEACQYALLVRAALEGAEDTGLPDGFLRGVGGERRPAWIARCPAAADPWPGYPDALRQAFAQPAQGLRLVLTTPALFEHGWRPAWLNESLQGSPPGTPGLRLKLRAVALERWQAFSGWDMRPPDGRRGGAARAVRRLVPAGSVYWFDILEDRTQGAAMEALWLSSVCDREADRRDGFGLVLPGVWTPGH